MYMCVHMCIHIYIYIIYTCIHTHKRRTPQGRDPSRREVLPGGRVGRGERMIMMMIQISYIKNDDKNK